jgi:hypothetical protein
MQPIEVDIAVGCHGQRTAWRYEGLACVDPHEFVRRVQDVVEEMLDEAKAAMPEARAVGASIDSPPPPEAVTVNEPEAPRGKPSKPKPPRPVVVDLGPDEPVDRLTAAAQRRQARLDQRLGQRAS